MRYLSFFVALLLCLSVIAFAVPPIHSVVENGDTFLRTFKLSDQPLAVQNMFESIIKSENSVLVSYGSYQYHILSVPDGVDVTFTRADQYSPIAMRFSSSVQYMTFEREGDYFIYSGSPSASVIPIGLVCGGVYFDRYAFPDLSTDYIAEITGRLIVEWDTQEDKPTDNIWGWLTGFWQKFVDTIKGLFVPSDSYFSSFFNDIKTAFDNKLGGVGSLLGSLSSSLEDLDTVSGGSSLVIKLPDNFFFSGYSGLTVDVLKPLLPLISFVRGIFNSFLVVVTIIICYRKVIAIVHT